MKNNDKHGFNSIYEPTIMFNPAEGKFKIEGKSVVESTERFYGPICDQLKEYVKNPKEVTNFEFQLEFINTNSSKWILKLFYILEDIKSSGKQLDVFWIYDSDDDDIKDSGIFYASMVSYDVKLISNEV